VGWIHFAGVFYLVAAVFNANAGVAGLERAERFDTTRLLVSNLETWSWVFIALAVAQLALGVAVLRRLRAGRIPAIVAAVAGMVAWFVAWAILPFWGLVMMILYGLIIYALTAFREYFA
jgi:NAD/NADP transhydrogenase beta subunit